MALLIQSNVSPKFDMKFAGVSINFKGLMTSIPHG